MRACSHCATAPTASRRRARPPTAATPTATSLRAPAPQASRPSATTRPTGRCARAWTTYAYDNARRLTEVWNRAASGATISRHTYVLNARGERTRADEVLPVLSQPLLAQTSRSTSYSYDALSRLVNAVDPDVSTTYAYDPVGNRTRRTRATASVTETLDYPYDRADRIQSAGGRLYTVDANGNIVSRSGPLGSDTFSYDQANRLVRSSLAGTDVVSYSYDGDGNRRSKGVVVGLGYTLDVNRALPVVVTDVENKYVWGASLTHARGPLGSVTVEGNTVPLQLGVVHADGLGSVRALTSEDGSVFQTYRTDEFGVPILTDSLGASLQPFQFFGEQRDIETGFVYLRSRYYVPEIGRFLTRDRSAGFRRLPVSLNRYTYAWNDPVKYRDPSGFGPGSATEDDAAQLDAGPGGDVVVPISPVPSPSSVELAWSCFEATEVAIITVGTGTALIALGAGGLAGSGPLAATGGGAVVAVGLAVASLEAIFAGVVSVAGGVYFFGSTCAIPAYERLTAS